MCARGMYLGRSRDFSLTVVVRIVSFDTLLVESRKRVRRVKRSYFRKGRLKTTFFR